MAGFVSWVVGKSEKLQPSGFDCHSFLALVFSCSIFSFLHSATSDQSPL